MQTRILTLLLSLVLLGGHALAATALQDTLTFACQHPDTLLNTKGWLTLLARSGGWGQFPAHYTYQVQELDGRRCLVDAYPFAQNHGHVTAILLDWDGDPVNGATPLAVTPGLRVAFQLSAYLQPYARGWKEAGTGHVIWSCGPGVIDPHAPPITEAKAVAAYDWVTGRGPRLQYRHGYEIDGNELAQPQLRACSPERATAAVDGKTLPTNSWVDLRLSITINAALTAGTGLLQTRASGTEAWTEQGRWTFPIDLQATDARNPQRWNALLLDSPLLQWAKQGYGDPTPAMRDRYDRFVIEVTPEGAAGAPRHGVLLLGERPTVAMQYQGDTTLYTDDAPSWTLTLVNDGDTVLAGALVARVPGTPARTRVVAPTCRLPARGSSACTFAPRPLLLAGTQQVEFVLRDAAGGERVVGTRSATLLPHRRPVPGLNLVRNGGFELGPHFNGTPMRQGAEFFQMFVKEGDRPRWSRLDAEGWWAEGADAAGISLGTPGHTGSRCLRVAPPAGATRAVISAFDRRVPGGAVTLSAWVKTADATARLDLDGVAGWEGSGAPAVRASVPLPATTGWTRLTVTAIAPRDLDMRARLQVEAGVVYLDDVQIEVGPTASAFRARPEEWLCLSVVGTPEETLPKWVQGEAAARAVRVRNAAGFPLSGTVRLTLGPWDDPTQRTLATFDAATLAPGAAKTVPFSTKELAPNAYVLAVTLTQHDVIIADGVGDFAFTEGIGGTVSNGMLRARTAARFVIAPSTPPARIFGVGNSMLGTGCGSWFGGWTLAGYDEARPLRLTSTRCNDGDEETYLSAAAGTSITVMGLRADLGAPAGASFANPAYPDAIDIYDPQGWAFFLKRAEETGRRFAANPLVVSYQMSNESPYLNNGRLCPSTAADADFRAWCRQRYPTLDALNARWQRAYTSWEEVEQISSARFAEEVQKIPPKVGAAATDWMANTGTYSPEILARMQAHPGQAMDWLRWRTASSLRMYTAFRTAARKADPKTLYGTNLCWPAFWPQMFMPFIRATDNVQLDVQYTSGQPRALGTPSEMMDSMEMAESTQPGKPVWGIEVYMQPQWPAEYVAFQTWGLLAHGMTNDLTFAWYPYSDHGPVKEPRAWEKPDAHPMWFLIDTDRTRLPAYTVYQRAVEEVRAFHQRHDGLSLARAATPVAFYVSPDTAEYVIYQTGNKPWESVWQRTRNVLVYALRMHGVTVRYVDDATLPAAPGAFSTIVVPAAYVLDQRAAAQLASFAKAGGTVVLAGMTGVVDPWLAKYDTIGGPAWAELAWRAPEFTPAEAPVAFAPAPAPAVGFRGTHPGAMPGATPITDTRGATVGWERAWGKGRLVAYAVLPDSYDTDPRLPANVQAWTAQLIARARLPVSGRWVSTAPVVAGPVGTGSPAVEVVVRTKTPSERFVFCLNQGGAGDGTVEVPVPPGAWRAEDALTGAALPGSVTEQTWRLPLHLEAYGYRVMRLVKR